MKQRNLLIGAILALVVIGAGAVGYQAVSRDKSTDTTASTTQNQSTGSDNTATDTGSESGRTRNIVLTNYNAKFALPARFDVTDVKIIYQTEEKYELAVVASKTLPSKLNKDKCYGGTVELGSFAEITRYKTPPSNMSGVQKVGDYYYRVDEGPATSGCYDQATFEHYYGDDVVSTIKSSLTVR